MKSGKVFASLPFFFATILSQSIRPYNFTTANGFNLSQACLNVLNQNVTCDSSLEWAGTKNRYEDDATLTKLCTTTCTNALTLWRSRAAGACTTRLVASNGDAVLPAYFVEKIFERYSITCQQNGGRFCNAVLRDAIGVNPVDQKVTKSSIPSSVTCEDCFLKQIQTQLQMPLSSNPDLAKTFTSLTKQCSKSGFAVTPPATTTLYVTTGLPPSTSGMTSIPTPTGCVGTTYTLKSTDTCQSISLAQGISTADLLTANGLKPYCEDFPRSGSLCIPTAAKCKTYTIKSSDSCVTIADMNKLTFVQFVTWNPVVGQTCSLIKNFVGWTSCISNPGGSWVNPSPSDEPKTSQTPTSAFIGTDPSLLPTPGYTGSVNGSDIWTYRYAEGTRLDCYLYANGSNFGSSASCADVAKAAGVTPSNLTDWNSSLKSSCTLNGDFTYCVQPLQFNATNHTPYCILADTPDYGMGCEDFLAVWGLNITHFASWNPGVGSQCENWLNGRDYCVMVHQFKQSGIVSNCNQYATCNESHILADPCAIIETKFGIQHGRFVAWNPAVGQDCLGIRYGYDYCVSTLNFKPTYTAFPHTWPTEPFHIRTGGAPLTTAADPKAKLVATSTVSASGKNVASNKSTSVASSPSAKH